MSPKLAPRNHREHLYEIIFEAETPAGKAFDVALLFAILASVLAVMLESVPALEKDYGELFFWIEVVFTILFTIEYGLRIYCVNKPWKYIFSFFGVVDLLSILPLYIAFFLPGTQFLVTVRAFRLLRVFRVLKMGNYLLESSVLAKALMATRRRIAIFFGWVLVIVLLMATIIYVIESPYNPAFSSIPKAVYWAIVTVTTVGYGDISPVTGLGQFLSALLMLVGYAILAVPTGIVSVEMAQAESSRKTDLVSTLVCSNCHREGHDSDARFCKFCGSNL